MTQPFHFPDGRIANDAKDLLELCEQYPDDATGFLVRQDLEKWLAYIGSHEVAECAANARQIDVGDRQKLEDFLNRCHSLTSPQAVASDTPEPNLEEKIEETIEESPVASVSTSSVPITETPLEDNIQAPTGQDLPQVLPSEQMSAPETSPETSAEPATPVAPVLPVIPSTSVAKTTTLPNSSTIKTPVNSNSTSTNEVKPGFFQVVAKFIVQILYQDKA
jgi:hypothetical protein